MHRTGGPGWFCPDSIGLPHKARVATVVARFCSQFFSGCNNFALYTLNKTNCNCIVAIAFAGNGAGLLRLFSLLRSGRGWVYPARPRNHYGRVCSDAGFGQIGWFERFQNVEEVQQSANDCAIVHFRKWWTVVVEFHKWIWDGKVFQYIESKPAFALNFTKNPIIWCFSHWSSLCIAKNL